MLFILYQCQVYCKSGPLMQRNSEPRDALGKWILVSAITIPYPTCFFLFFT